MRAITCSNTAGEERQLLIWKDKVMAPATDQMNWRKLPGVGGSRDKSAGKEEESEAA